MKPEELESWLEEQRKKIWKEIVEGFKEQNPETCWLCNQSVLPIQKHTEDYLSLPVQLKLEIPPIECK